jgi:hypothetical protein
VVEEVGDFFWFSFGKLRGILCVRFCSWWGGWGLFLKMQIKNFERRRIFERAKGNILVEGKWGFVGLGQNIVPQCGSLFDQTP